MDQHCVVFVPNQTEENSSRIETRSFFMCTRKLGIYLSTWEVHSWKCLLIKATTCCPLAPSTCNGIGGSSTLLWLLLEEFDLYLTGHPKSPSQKSLFFLFPSMPPVVLGWGAVCRPCTCHLELPVGKNHTLLLSSYPEGHCTERGSTKVC